MTEKVLRRARQSDEKLERRRQILAAAEALFVEGAGELPTVQAIADRAGVAKGTRYLYFATVVRTTRVIALLKGRGRGLRGRQSG